MPKNTYERTSKSLYHKCNHLKAISFSVALHIPLVNDYTHFIDSVKPFSFVDLDLMLLVEDFMMMALRALSVTNSASWHKKSFLYHPSWTPN